MLDRTQLGKRIKEARLRTGMSQQELANAIGVSDKTISAYEVGRVDPPLESLEKLSSATKHPIAYFIGDVQSNIEAKLERIATELAEIRAALKNEAGSGGMKPPQDLPAEVRKVHKIEKQVEHLVAPEEKKVLEPAPVRPELPKVEPPKEIPTPLTDAIPMPPPIKPIVPPTPVQPAQQEPHSAVPSSAPAAVTLDASDPTAAISH